MDRKAAKRQRREKRKAGRGRDEVVNIVFTDKGLREVRKLALLKGDTEEVAKIDGIIAYRAAHPNWQSEPASQ